MKRLLISGLVIALAACSERAPQLANTNAPVDSSFASADPALALDETSGDVLMTWVAGDSTSYHLYFARSADGGGTWSAPVRITTTPNDVKPHGQASPRLVAANGAIAVFWPNNIHVAGRRFPASHLRFSRSTDGGATWTPATTLNDDTTAALAGHTFHGAVFVPPSTFAVAWLDSRTQDPVHRTATAADPHEQHDGDATIYMARSNDLGATWSLQNTKLWGDACPCCRVSLAARSDGVIVAAWRSHMSGDVRDPVVATIGDAPSAPVRVHADDWVFAGCPHTGPALHVSETGVTSVAWYSGKPGSSGIFFAETGGDSLAFSTPIELVGAAALPTGHPAIARGGRGAFVAFDINAAGRQQLSVAHIRDGRATTVSLPDSDGADHPQIIVMPDGAALVAWTEKSSTGTRVRMTRFDD